MAEMKFREYLRLEEAAKAFKVGDKIMWKNDDGDKMTGVIQKDTKDFSGVKVFKIKTKMNGKGKEVVTTWPVGEIMRKASLMESEDLNEGRGKKVTKMMWNKMSEDERVEALLTAIDDPDKAEEMFDAKWEDLPSVAKANMVKEDKDCTCDELAEGEMCENCQEEMKEGKKYKKEDEDEDDDEDDDEDEDDEDED